MKISDNCTVFHVEHISHSRNGKPRKRKTFHVEHCAWKWLPRWESRRHLWRTEGGIQKFQ